MMSFTKCKLMHSHKTSVNAALLDDTKLVVERGLHFLRELYISSPEEFVGHWVYANEPIFHEHPLSVGLSGIVYHKVIDEIEKS
ncbi:hypothetical protein NQ752_001665 [Escherichia coli]|nr:hypothetical protein [Escherichia coli]